MSRWRIGVPAKVFDGIRSNEKPSDAASAPRSRNRRGPGRSRKWAKNRSPVKPGHRPPVLVGHQARGDEVLDLPGLVDGRNGAQPRAGQRAGVVDDRAEDGIDIETPGDAQARPAQPGQAVLQQLALSPQVVGLFTSPPIACTRSRHPAPCRHMAAAERPEG